MEKILIIVDRKWYDENKKLIKEIKFNREEEINLITVNTKSPNFSYIILNEISQRKSEQILLINTKFNSNHKILNEIIDKIKQNQCLIYSKKLLEFDFTLLENDTIICFSSDIFKKDLSQYKFSTFLNLQKYLISYIVKSSRFLVKLLSGGPLKWIDAVTNEDVIIKNTRKNKPKKY